ncbi:MAG: molybdopterin-dependent oxidoreductase, partial [Coriobacteriales bacterium]|nr:molybdopterin-dependent oxidoreductase [Coriobacteriales bacterium]
LKKVEFLVTCDYFMTSSGIYSDYVMPIAGALERPTLHTNYGVTDSLLASQRAIQPLYERHTDYAFWRDLALATGQDPDQWPWATEEEVFYYVLYPLGLPVNSYDEFVESYRFYYPPMHYYKYGTNGFSTPSRRVELKSSILEKLGYPPLPTYIGPAENEEDDPEVAKEYPLVLTTGGGFMPYHHSEHFNVTPVRFLRSEPYFTINPEKAAELNIADDDWCWIETRRGRIKQRANLEPSVDPRVVYAQRGWWYPERGHEGDEPFGCLTSNVNVLSSVDDEHCDPIGGSWANRGLLCKVYKVRYGDEEVETQFSIPGSSSEPGVTVPPSEQKLAYELVPYNPGAPFEVPEGLTWDENTQLAWELERGLAYDPESGWLYHPETMIYYDLETKYAYDPTTETLVDEASGQRYDMTTKQLIGDETGNVVAEAPAGSVAEAASAEAAEAVGDEAVGPAEVADDAETEPTEVADDAASTEVAADAAPAEVVGDAETEPTEGTDDAAPTDSEGGE